MSFPFTQKPVIVLPLRLQHEVLDAADPAAGACLMTSGLGKQACSECWGAHSSRLHPEGKSRHSHSCRSQLPLSSNILEGSLGCSPLSHNRKIQKVPAPQKRGESMFVSDNKQNNRTWNSTAVCLGLVPSPTFLPLSPQTCIICPPSW